VVLAIPGGPAPLGARSGLSGLALALAAQGAVVFAADYRSMPAQNAGFPQTFEDVACAVRTARTMAAKYGGDPARVTLVGNSLGGWPGAVIAFSTQPFPLDATNCLAQAGSSRPDAFVGVAGVYTLDKIDPGYLDAFFGGTRQTAPGAWAAGDPYAIVNANRNGTIPVTLVDGDRDQTVPLASTQLFTGLLTAAGYAAQLTVVPGATHDAVLTAPQTVAAILGVVRGR
jgi:acetyl esterase/lipase